MLFVVEQYGDAVGGRHTDAHIGKIGHQGIYSLQMLVPSFRRQTEEIIVNDSYLSEMNLMRHDQLRIVYAQQLAQGCPILGDMLAIIATIDIDIELTITIRAKAPMTSGAESNGTTSQFVVQQLRNALFLTGIADTACL